MPTYRYQLVAAPSGGGAAGMRTIDAPDRASALRAIVLRGETPSKLEELELREGGKGNGADPRPATSTGATGVKGMFAGAAMSRAETAGFIRDLAVAVNAGLPLVAALKTIARQGRNERQQGMLEFLIEQVEGGDTLSDAMAAFGRPFNDLIISLVRAGEAAGKLGETLRHAADLLERDLKLRRSVLGSLLYPAIIGVLVAGGLPMCRVPPSGLWGASKCTARQ